MKMAGETSNQAGKSGKPQGSGAALHRGTDLRLALPHERLDCLPVTEVPLNLNCRDALSPLLRALQQLYGNVLLRRELVGLVGKDGNQTTSRKQGRRGLSYWEITVLPAVRLGCNLDYDKLQDLAENDRSLRRSMGIGDWQDEEVDFAWRRLQDNLSKLRPETLKKRNDLGVTAGQQLAPQAITAVRGDTFVGETNSRYPTQASLLPDGLRKVVTLAAALARRPRQAGWRQHQ